jgi:hypothetical protein
MRSKKEKKEERLKLKSWKIGKCFMLFEKQPFWYLFSESTYRNRWSKPLNFFFDALGDQFLSVSKQNALPIWLDRELKKLYF